MLNATFHPCAETDSPARLSPSRAQAEVAKTPADAQPGPTSTFFHYTALNLAEQEVAFLSELSRDQLATAGSCRAHCARLNTTFKRRGAQRSQKPALFRINARTFSDLA